MRGIVPKKELVSFGVWQVSTNQKGFVHLKFRDKYKYSFPCLISLALFFNLAAFERKRAVPNG